MTDILALLATADATLAVHVEGGDDAPDTVRTVSGFKLDGNPDAKRSAGFAKVKAEKSAKTSPVVAIVPPAPPPVPTKETAEKFIAALRDAGKRPDAKGAMVRDATLVRSDEAAALAAFVGYSKSEPHGVQLDSARRKAQNLTSPGWGEDRKVRTPPTTAGYVQGAPKPGEKLLADLRGKHRAIVDAACAMERKGDQENANKLLAIAKKLDEQIRALTG